MATSAITGGAPTGASPTITKVALYQAVAMAQRMQSLEFLMHRFRGSGWASNPADIDFIQLLLQDLVRDRPLSHPILNPKVLVDGVWHERLIVVNREATGYAPIHMAGPVLAYSDEQQWRLAEIATIIKLAHRVYESRLAQLHTVVMGLGNVPIKWNIKPTGDFRLHLSPKGVEIQILAEFESGDKRWIFTGNSYSFVAWFWYGSSTDLLAPMRAFATSVLASQAPDDDGVVDVSSRFGIPMVLADADWDKELRIR